MTDFADQFKADAAAINSLRPVDEMSDRLRVMAMAASIKNALDRGVTWAAIERRLRELGITVTLAVIQNYFRASGVRSPSRRQKTKSSVQIAGRNPTLRNVETTFSRPTAMKGDGASIQTIRPDSKDL